MIRKFYDGLATLGGGETTKGAGEVPDIDNKNYLFIEAIEAATRDYKLKFTIKYGMSKHGVRKNDRKWIVSVMGEDFVDSVFGKAVKEACAFILNANSKIIK